MKRMTMSANMKVFVPASSYDFNADARLLIPFTEGEKIGFANVNGEIVVRPQYNMYYGDCYSAGDLIKVSINNVYGILRSGGNVSCYHRPLFGMINYLGEVVLDTVYNVIIPATNNKKLFTVQNNQYQYGVIDSNGNEIIPFGKYDWIDGFDRGLARVKKGVRTNGLANSGAQWGIINEQGEEVLPIEYDDIWSFYGKSYPTIIATKNGVTSQISFSLLGVISNNCSYPDTIREEYDNPRYGEFEGSYAQDVMGYSDDVINDAFEGDSDAYWNID